MGKTIALYPIHLLWINNIKRWGIMWSLKTDLKQVFTHGFILMKYCKDNFEFFNPTYPLNREAKSNNQISGINNLAGSISFK